MCSIYPSTSSSSSFLSTSPLSCLVSLSVNGTLIAWSEPFSSTTTNNNNNSESLIHVHPFSIKLDLGAVLAFYLAEQLIVIVTESSLDLLRVVEVVAKDSKGPSSSLEFARLGSINIFDKLVSAPSLIELRLIKIALHPSRGFIVLTTSSRSQSWVIDVQTYLGIRKRSRDKDCGGVHPVVERQIEGGGSGGGFVTPSLCHKITEKVFCYFKRDNGKRLYTYHF